MTAQLVELEGTLNWAKVFSFNKDTNEDYHGPGGAYTVDVLLEKDQLDKLTKSGSRLKPKVTDDGIAIRFKRKHINAAGIEEFGGPPKVVDAEKELWPEGVLIGNGSKGKVYISVYETKLGKGTRLEGIQVTDHVQFEGEGGGGVDLPF